MSAISAHEKSFISKTNISNIKNKKSNGHASMHAQIAMASPVLQAL
jgi:hypothetical protein